MMLKKIIKCLLLIVTIAYIYLNNVPSNANQQSDIKTLEELSMSLYESVQVKDYENAKLIIEEIADIFPNIDYKGLTNVEGIEALSKSIINTKKVLASLEPKYSTILNNVTQLRLAVDALSHKEQPLWKRYYSVIYQDIEQIRRAYQKQDENQLQESIKGFELHYKLIKPALLVSEKKYIVEKIDSLIVALISHVGKENYEKLINELQSSFQQLFYGTDIDVIGGITYKSILGQVSIGVILIILLTLSYVVLKKYNARSV